MKCKWYRQMHNFKSSVCHDSNIGAGFLSLCRDVLLKLHGGMEKGIRCLHVLRETWICRNFLLKQIHSIVVWKMCSYTHTHIYIFIYSSRPGSSLYCSLLIFMLRGEKGRGRTEGRPREICPALPHTQSRCAHLAAPKQGEGCGEREERGTPGTWPALSRGGPSLPKTLGPESSRGLSSGSRAAKWVFNIYLKERVGTKR